MSNIIDNPLLGLITKVVTLSSDAPRVPHGSSDVVEAQYQLRLVPPNNDTEAVDDSLTITRTVWKNGSISYHLGGPVLITTIPGSLGLSFTNRDLPTSDSRLRQISARLLAETQPDQTPTRITTLTAYLDTWCRI